MIYILQPFTYKNGIYNLIKYNLTNLSYSSIKRIFPFQLSNIKYSNNVYFIIHDTNYKIWDGFNIAKIIRQKDYTANIILITNDLDYQKYYRSHIRFLSIIDISSKQIENDIQEILEYLIK
ncbi:TPA: hypothetical protein U1032_002101 [Streptococcus suis]|nr:hypothetical protein [Streptococcus suis]HEM4698175.1 hypothetical protein [Streptococcus suis]HEM4702123.1 hypothetical protein [Streptococcus suis]HEM4702316.1 hypothetical protein [Streptococcus suis]HEM4841468.1 hypothetical protein [Streptococcus suis]